MTTSTRAIVVPIDDRRWRFQDDAQLPKPREFSGGSSGASVRVPRRYRAGRGSSVPLDLGAFLH
jgi:hypothetical protein